MVASIASTVSKLMRTSRMEMRFANIEAEGGADGQLPFAFGLQWMVDFSHEFIGKEALQQSWDAGLSTTPGRPVGPGLRQRPRR